MLGTSMVRDRMRGPSICFLNVWLSGSNYRDTQNISATHRCVTETSDVVAPGAISPGVRVRTPPPSLLHWGKESQDLSCRGKRTPWRAQTADLLFTSQTQHHCVLDHGWMNPASTHRAQSGGLQADVMVCRGSGVVAITSRCGREGRWFEPGLPLLLISFPWRYTGCLPGIKVHPSFEP